MMYNTHYRGSDMMYHSPVEIYDNNNNLIYLDQWNRMNLGYRYMFRETYLKRGIFGHWNGMNNIPFDSLDVCFEECQFNYALDGSAFEQTFFKNCEINASFQDLKLRNQTVFDFCVFNSVDFCIEEISESNFYGCRFNNVVFGWIPTWNVFSHCAFIDCDFNNTYIDWFMFAHNHLTREEQMGYRTLDSGVLQIASEMQNKGIPNNEIISFLQL